MVELTPSGSFCLGWAWGVSQSVLLLVDACWSCERSLHTRGSGGLFARLAWGWERARERKTESWQRERRGESESRWRWRIDRWFVNLRGFDRSIPPPPPLWCSRTSWARESVNSSQVPMDKICCYPEVMVGSESLRPHPKGSHSQVVVSSLPPCSLSLLRRGAETGAVPAQSPVPSLPGRMGLLVLSPAQVVPLQFNLCRWCSYLF